jgi:bifunctional DNA-binding transcriptional regulator/antitoxin component of YhaV-PrlF toxin-antitoxin module
MRASCREGGKGGEAVTETSRRVICRMGKLRTMGTTSNSSSSGFKVVVGEDGNLTVPAGELARHGVRPGARLWIIPEQRGGERRSMLGALKEAVPPEAVEDLLRGLDAAKAERIAYYTEQS